MQESEKSRLTSRIREEAKRLGFTGMGVAPAGELPGAERFDDWIGRGMQGEMAYMETQAARRKNPSLILENARSIVVLAMNYYTEGDLTDEPLRGRISRYAWGEDYHRVVQGRLKQLGDFIRCCAPAAHPLWYVDTGPVMEKAWGAQTSLGWRGKHTNLITRGQGSWFFIGVILLDLELENDAPEADYCGTCTRCLEVCPTRAIVAPYVVDARLCISYLTIELRGSIPRPLRRLIGNRIFGCDDCQEVCPWNRFAVPTPDEEFRPRNGHRMPELAPLVQITPDEFNSRFRGSPIRRAKRDGFVRNVVVALGNSRQPDAVPALAHAIKDRSALVRAHAAWALGQVDTAESRRLLEAAAGVEMDSSVLEEIALALDLIRNEPADIAD